MGAEKNEKKSSTGKIVGIVVAVVVVVVLVVAGVIFANQRNAKSSSSEATATSAQCDANVKALNAHISALKTTIESAQELSGVTADQVADPSVLTDLADSLKSAEAVNTEVPTCPADGKASDFQAAIDTARSRSEEVRGATNGLDAAVKVVTASQKAKTQG
ncbi:hypothetical protein [Bifidobacterium sp. UBA744]|uniref:hypothetical protein n=1 Tax=Bifidobacterium sp. UBA744 TaxID=1946112 RepID=UPI0025C321C1|nr:hypothetical protein [Bifidobacterium sp. UBA744]